MLASLKAADPDNLSVVVLGASAVDYQRVISVLDILQQLDITRIGLATVTVN
jgi:biopolymer transport protein ExbD